MSTRDDQPGLHDQSCAGVDRPEPTAWLVTVEGTRTSMNARTEWPDSQRHGLMPTHAGVGMAAAFAAMPALCLLGVAACIRHAQMHGATVHGRAEQADEGGRASTGIVAWIRGVRCRGVYGPMPTEQEMQDFSVATRCQ